MLVSLLGQRGVNVLSDVMFVGMLCTMFAGIVRVAYVKVYGPWPNNRGTRFLAFVLELFSNILGAFNKWRVARGDSPIFTTPEADARDATIADLRARLAALEPVPVAQRASVLRAPTVPEVVRVPSVRPAAVDDLPADLDDADQERRYQAAKRFVADQVGERLTAVPDEIPPVSVDSETPE
jgi:hypothetical protein